jgi:hypothetical protein
MARYYEPTESRGYHLFFEEVTRCSPQHVAATMHAQCWADDARPVLLISTRPADGKECRNLRRALPVEGRAHLIAWLKFASIKGKALPVLVVDAEPVFNDERVFPTIKPDSVLSIIAEVSGGLALHAVQVIGDSATLAAVRVGLGVVDA